MISIQVLTFGTGIHFLMPLMINLMTLSAALISGTGNRVRQTHRLPKVSLA